MKLSRIGWALWAVLPVGGLAYHFGPGQEAYAQERSAALQKNVIALEKEAEAAQRAAYASHLEALAARRAAERSPSQENEAKSTAATEAATREYEKASTAWQKVADAWKQVESMATGATEQALWRARWSRSRALVRSGEIWTGISELESMLAKMDAANKADSPAGLATREELASAYYYAARLMRLSGDPPEEWLVESGKARQQFRYLAERAQSTGGSRQKATDYQRNVELVLDLEQNSMLEIQGTPLPEDSPMGRKGKRPGQGEGKKSRRPPDDKDGRGAGGAQAVTTGW